MSRNSKRGRAAVRAAASQSGQRVRPYVPPTAASLTKLLPQLGGRTVTIESGTVQASPRAYWSGPTLWTGPFFSIPEPPEGRILWFSIGFDWQLWEWSFGFYRPNASNKDIRIDFGISWEYELVPNPWYTSAPGRFMWERDRYEFYTSLSPGASSARAGWIVPANSVTLAADSKESSPTPLQLLLNTKVGGKLRLWYRMRFDDMLINGEESHLPGGIYSGPDYIHYSYAIELPRVSIPTPDVGPVMG